MQRRRRKKNVTASLINRSPDDNCDGTSSATNPSKQNNLKRETKRKSSVQFKHPDTHTHAWISLKFSKQKFSIKSRNLGFLPILNFKAIVWVGRTWEKVVWTWVHLWTSVFWIFDIPCITEEETSARPACCLIDADLWQVQRWLTTATNVSNKDEDNMRTHRAAAIDGFLRFIRVPWTKKN